MRVKLYEQVKQFPKTDVTLKVVRDHVKDTLSLAMIVGNKVSEVNVNLENIPTIDVIHLNRETSDILNTKLLKATIQVSKMESNKNKTRDLLRKERVENKALRIKIKKFQDDLLKGEGKLNQEGAAQKLLVENEKEVQILKKKLEIPSTQLIQTSYLTNCKSKILKLEEKEKQWEKEAKLLKESEKDLKSRLATKEKELQEKCGEVENPSTIPNLETNTTSLSNAMSQAKLKDVELTGLKQ